MCSSILAVAAAMILPAGMSPPSSLTTEDLSPALRAGQYAGASQLMIISKGGVVTYDDRPLGICHIEIMRDGTLKAAFPSKTLGRGKWRPVTLERSGNTPRMTWTAVISDDTYKVTAIPYSPKAYVFRLEIRNDGTLVGGAQQFYAIDPKESSVGKSLPLGASGGKF